MVWKGRGGGGTREKIGKFEMLLLIIYIYMHIHVCMYEIAEQTIMNRVSQTPPGSALLKLSIFHSQ